MLTKKHSFYSPPSSSSTFPFDSSSLPPPPLDPPNLDGPHKLAFRGPTDSSFRLRMKLFRVPHPVSFFLFSCPAQHSVSQRGEKKRQRFSLFPFSSWFRDDKAYLRSPPEFGAGGHKPAYGIYIRDIPPPPASAHALHRRRAGEEEEE